jgi:peptidoglycan/xylan/chitin deacetylase (PgdA/CDA1 family)
VIVARWRGVLSLATLLSSVLLLAPAAQATPDEDILHGCDALSLGDLERAKLFFDRAVAGSPTDPLGHVGLGLVYLHAGSSYATDAEREFSSASAVPEALAGLAWLALGSGDVTSAELYLADAAAMASPPIPNLALARAYLALTRGDAATARVLETAGRAQNADEAFSDCLASERYALLENPESAATLATRARAALRARAETNLGALRLNSPRGALRGESVIPRWFAPAASAAKPILLASPAEGGVVTGTAVIHALLPIQPGSARPYVAIQIDGRSLASTDSSYRFGWDTTRWPPGPHTITVSARVGAGESDVVSLERHCIVREATPAPTHDGSYELSRMRLEQWLCSPRLSQDWSATLDRLASGSAEIVRQQEDPGFRPLGPTTGLPDAGGPGGGSIQPLPGNLGPKVALFFDDGPNPVITPAILAILAKEGIHASFFLVGEQCEKYPDLVRRIALEGHTVGSHSYTHPNLSNLTPPELEREIAGSAKLISAILASGANPTAPPVRFFRCPGGNTGAAVTQAIQRAGLISLDNLSYNTWSHMDETPEQIAAQASATVQGALLLHNGDDKSVFVLPLLIQALRTKGCSFVTADELVAGR